MNPSPAPKASMLLALRPAPEALAAARRRLHWKGFSIFAVLVLGYLAAVHPATPFPWRLAAVVLLFHGIVALATGVMHDANHGAFSASPRVNALLCYTADVLGASSWCWRQQHNLAHHRHTNIDSLDGDIDQSPFARLHPAQPARWYTRFQHWYMWFLYGFMTLKWVLFGDLRTVASVLRQPPQHRPNLRRVDVLAMLLGKVLHFSWAVAVPSLFHPLPAVLAVYVAVSFVFGLTLAVVFQLAHCVDAASFPDAPARPLTGDEFARHQLATTVDIASGSRLGRWYVSWMFGGLDHQVEHHLAPRLPHTMYKGLAPSVDALASSRGAVRLVHPSFRAALASHFRHLKVMATA